MFPDSVTADEVTTATKQSHTTKQKFAFIKRQSYIMYIFKTLRHNCHHYNGFAVWNLTINNVNWSLSCVVLQIGVFLFGCAVSQSFTDIAKVSVGRMRPHFLDVCKPNFSTINCSLGYITNYTCTGEDSEVQEARFVTLFFSFVVLKEHLKWKQRVNETLCLRRKSFFSGHASFSLFTMLYLAVSSDNSLVSSHPYKHINTDSCENISFQAGEVVMERRLVSD